eukprot:gene21293-24163_t
MAVFNKDKPDYDDLRNKGDFDSTRYYRETGSNDPAAQYQMQNNGYGAGGYNAGQNALLQQQRQQQQMQSLRNQNQNEFSILNLGGAKQAPGAGGFTQQGLNGPGMGIFPPSGRSIGAAGAPFDTSSFPALGAPNPASRNTSYGNPAYGQIRAEEDFTIENENFPALPGSTPSSQKHHGDVSSAVVGNNGRDLGLVGGGLSGGASSASQGSASTQEYAGAFGNSLGSSGLNIGGLIGSQGSLLSSIASGTSTSGNTTEVRFGLAGLLDIIRMTDKDMNSLALGTDLTAFGLNLNAPESLFPTFASPFTDVALTPDPQFHTPACYLMHPPSLKNEHLSKFQLETLFYMFYSMPRDILQAVAAQELYRREWRFHGELKVWLKPRAPHELMQSHPSVMFVFFDVAAWETRLFTQARGPNVAAQLLPEDEVRVKIAPAVSS